MKTPVKAKKIFEKMAAIEQMERGKLCRMAGRPHYNHQTWQEGRNMVRYVPVDQVDSVQEAIDGYEEFMKLAQEYAEIIIERTRKRREKEFAKPSKGGRKARRRK